MKHLITLKDLTKKDIEAILHLAKKIKRSKSKVKNILKGKTLGLIFQKPSNRTRVSFEVGMYELGGNSIYLSPDEIKLGVREAVGDVAKTLSRYLQAVVLRTYSHNDILEFTKHSSIPVVNGLCDMFHPCQALADIYTIKEKLKCFKNKTLAYIGDGNNVCNSLIYACAKVGLNLNIATPAGYEPAGFVLKEAFEIFKKNKAKLLVVNDPKLAAKQADVIYTDVWASMGQEQEQEKRKQDFKLFQINSDLVSMAKKNVFIMHCLPAHRGEEIIDSVIDGKHSIVFDQAENRMHVQKAVLIKLLK
ncbi:MAG: ornithine carbamoyltransferase [Candidatus Gygaella obscura]|nr:ornithine carbamoyltransferase [Candidatus Gygaella obscura]